MEEPIITILQLTDDQLNVLNQIVREHKITLSNEELAWVALGKRKSPLIDLLINVATVWEKRKAEVESAAQQPQQENVQPLATTKTAKAAKKD